MLSDTDPTEANFLSSNLPIGNLSAILEGRVAAQVKSKLIQDTSEFKSFFEVKKSYLYPICPCMAQVRYLESTDLVLYLQNNPKITIVNSSTKNKWRLMWGLHCPAHVDTLLWWDRHTLNLRKMTRNSRFRPFWSWLHDYGQVRTFQNLSFLIFRVK